MSTHVTMLVATALSLASTGGSVNVGPPATEAAAAATRDYAQPVEGTTVDIDMVWVPEGNFWIGRTEITWEQYLPFCAWESKVELPRGTDALARPSKPLDVFPYHRDWGAGTRPAVGMSWAAAKKYCAWLSRTTGHAYRLPTEAEWLAACGPEPASMLDHAWCADNSQRKTQPAGTRAPNEHGVHDMFGNLWEYCANPYDPADPKRAVLRGGSWREPAAKIMRTARLRFNNDWTLEDPNFPPGLWWIPDGDHLGFRILRVSDENETVKDGANDEARP